MNFKVNFGVICTRKMKIKKFAHISMGKMVTHSKK